jgi:hypothetical protein
MAELEVARKTKTKAIISAPKKEDSEVEVQQHVSCRKLRVVTDAAPDGQNCGALRREQLACK